MPSKGQPLAHPHTEACEAKRLQELQRLLDAANLEVRFGDMEREVQTRTEAIRSQRG